MRTFEGWIAYQAMDIASLSADDVRAWRGYYEETCEANRQRRIWTRTYAQTPTIYCMR